jgi:hypothetical protein
MINNKQQTAVNKLETQIEKLRYQGVTEWQCGYQKALNEVVFLLKQAKEMEKEQIIDAIDYCRYKYIDSENYYNETFNK